MIGLALEGGGVRGSYQAGVYIAMLECGVHIDGVCGTSIGALNASFIASGKGSMLATVWRSLNMGQIFGFSEDFIKIMNQDKIKMNDFDVIIKEMLGILSKRGIDLEGLKKVIDQYLDVDALMKSPIDFGLVTVRMRDLKPLHIWKKDMSKEQVKDYIIASSFLPLFKMEKLVDGEYYLDGGFYDLGPVNMMLEAGYEKVYLVKVHGVGISRKYDKSKDVVVIESKRSLGGVLDLNPHRIVENINMGYYDALRILKHYDGEAFVIKVKSEKYYAYLNRKIPKREYRRVKNFFNTKTYKDTTIKALEYIMEKEGMNYYKIYQPKKIIKAIKKETKKKHFIYDYVRNLKFFI